MQQQYPGWRPSPPPTAPPPAPGPPAAASPAPAPRRRGRRLLIGGLVVAGLAVAAGFGVQALVASSTAAPLLDGRALERGVEQILVDEYGLARPEWITCPDGQPVHTDAVFDCTTRSKLGLTKPVKIKITTPAGDYMVGKPG